MASQQSKPIQQSIDFQFARLMEEQRSFLNEVKHDRNKEISTVIERYEQKLEAVHNSALQMSLVGSLDMTKHDNSLHPTSRSDAMAMKREVKELRSSLQECEQSLLRAMDNLKENRMTINRLKQSNSAYCLEINELKTQNEHLRSNLKEAQKEAQIQKREESGVYSSPISCIKKKAYIDEKLEVAGRVDTGPSLPLDFRGEESRFMERDISSKSKSPVPIRVLSLLDSNQSKAPELNTEDDTCYQVTRTPAYPYHEQRKPLEEFRPKSPIPSERENRSKVNVFTAHYADYRDIVAEDMSRTEARNGNQGWDKENVFKQPILGGEENFGLSRHQAKGRLQDGRDGSRGCQQTFKMEDSCRNSGQGLPESQVSSLLNKIEWRQNAMRQNYIKNEPSRPPTPVRKPSGVSREIKRRPETTSDRGFLNFYRENSRTSSFILEDD